jgi:arylsulfatase
MMEEVFEFAASFGEYPPRSFPPSFNPTTVLEATLRSLREAREKATQKST